MQRRWTRRQVMRATGAGVAAVTLGGVGAWEGDGMAVAADEFGALRAKWRDLLTGGGGYDPQEPQTARAIAAVDNRARGYWERMDKTPGRGALWRDLGPGTSETSYLTTTFQRLADMARAWATHGSALEGNDALLADTVGGLDAFVAGQYNETIPIRGNWWDWEIGSPLALNNATVLLYDRLSAAQRDAYMRAIEAFTPVPDQFARNAGPTTGANRVWKAEAVAVRAAVVGDGAKLARARDALSAVFPYVTHGEGFYADGGFIQHDKHPYTGGYGTSLLIEIAALLHLLDGSTWNVTDPQRQNVYDAVYSAFEPVMWRGAQMDMVRGREIARPVTQDHQAGHNVTRAVLTLMQTAPPADAAVFARMVKGWIQGDTYRDFLATAPLAALLQARVVLADPAITPRDPATLHRQYASMDRVVHRRPGWAFGVAMSSARIFTYESINGENLHAWHTGDGMAYLYTGDLAQFSDDFWPTVDPYRLPGTTVDTGKRADASGQSKAPATQWAGGVALGEFGTAGMDLAAFGTTLRARKSWFLLDDAVVALGAGIASTDNRTIETIIENRKLAGAGDAALTVDGAAQPANLGWSGSLRGVDWAHLDGVAGYVFPGGADMQAVREARTGSWNTINKSYTTPATTRNYLTLWFDHGADPSGATYAYALLPNATAEATRAYAAAPDATILRNDADVQAIRAARLHLTAAHFWRGGAADFLHAASPAAAIAREENGTLAVAVSDPTQTQDTLTIELDRAAASLVSNDPTVTVTQLAPTVRLTVHVAGSHGASHTATLALAT